MIQTHAKHLLIFGTSIVLLTINNIICSSLVFLAHLCRWLLSCLCLPTTLVLLVIKQLESLHAKILGKVLFHICGTNLMSDQPSPLPKDQSYVLIINHRSWLDIMLLLVYFEGKLPHIRFFLKRSLLWIPWLGPLCYSLGHIFIDRPKSNLDRKSLVLWAKNQQKRIRQGCNALFRAPCTLAIFVEGTRFSEEKSKHSDYQHLLTPQHTGLSIIQEAGLHSIQPVCYLDISLSYAHESRCILFDYLSGKYSNVCMKVETIRLPPILSSPNTNPNQIKRHWMAWLSTLWQNKDRWITEQISHRPS